jgi:hypothetical protein
MRALRVRRTSPFFLIVNIQIQQGQIGAFETEMPNLQGVFGDNDFKLLLAGVREEERGDTHSVVHLWHMPSANRLLTGMSLLADNIAYTRLDDLIVDENQNLGTPSRHYSSEDVLRPWQERRARKHQQRGERRDRYLFLTERVDPSGLAEYGARYEERLDAFNAENGWGLGEGLLHITGGLNRVSRAWVVPTDLTETDARNTLDRSPGASCADSRSREIVFLRETSYEAAFAPGTQ